MKIQHKKRSKRTKLSTKYNIQKKVREHNRRIRKEAKKLGLKKPKKKDPGIPNSWPFKAQMLEQLQKQKEERDKEMEERKLKAREDVRLKQEQLEEDRREAERLREETRREKRAAEAEKRQLEALYRALVKSNILLITLDIRDPVGCRSQSLEAWAHRNGKRVVFVLTKADLAPPNLVAHWLESLGHVAPTVAVAVEAGGEGVSDLLQVIGHAPAQPGAGQAADQTSQGDNLVGIVGYPGTGKKSVAKAMRREAKGLARWLLEGVGRLKPTPGPKSAVETLHLAIRGGLSRGKSFAEGDASASDVVSHLLTRAPQQSFLRRFRAPAFDSTEGLLTFLAKGKLTSRKNALRPEVMARIFLTEQLQTPVCICTPPSKEELQASAPSLWAPHAATKPQQEAVMLRTIQTFKERPSAPVAGMLELSTHGFGPAIDLASAVPDNLEGEDAEDADLSDDDEDDEEEMEGEEEEEDEDDDDAMGD